MGLPDAAEDLASFIGVDLADDAGPQEEARIAETLSGLDQLGGPPQDYDEPVRPPEIIEARSSQTIPLVVAAVLAVLGALGLAVAAWSSARSRRRQLAVLRAVGLHVQAGAPVRAGPVAWRPPPRRSSSASRWASLSGGSCGERSPVNSEWCLIRPAAWTSIGLLVVGGLALAALAAIVPARRAAASSPGADLRAE